MTRQNINIHLGWEIGSGVQVDLPLRHTVITGQTQEAGKTTTLEALISRSALRAVTFITKRGEGSFQNAHRTDPYFREQADWQFVASILEASRGEKMKFERPWIIRASAGATKLADVHANVKREMAIARGLNADIYLVLNAYLDVVIPEIEKITWAKTVDLQPGVNAMDLADLSDEMQHLVIKSTLDWVLRHAENTVVVVPEAWKFIPQGRGTPVKLSAEMFIRQAAGLGCYLWLDSQDIAGVDKLILKSCPVWVLGVQREHNEIMRTLLQIPAGLKRPKTQDIATLGLGEFFACYGKDITKVYVQPAWMPAEEAQAIARHSQSVDEATPPPPPPPPPPPRHVTVVTPPPVQEEREIVKKLAKPSRTELEQQTRDLQAELERLRRLHEPSPKPVLPPAPGPSVAPAVGPVIGVPLTDWGDTETERTYQAFKRRLLAELPTDPVTLKILTHSHELLIKVERQVVTVNGTSGPGWIGRLILDKWFDEPKLAGTTFNELKRRGVAVGTSSIPNWCNDMVRRGFLTKEGTAWLVVPGMKINLVES